MSVKIHVAIIDDGVYAGFLNTHLLYNVEIAHGGVEDGRSLNHGTLCAAIVQTYFPDAIISSVKIMNHRKGNAVQLCAALDWCVKHGVHVANISLGSISYRDRGMLREAVNDAAMAGLIMVCAAQNGGLLTYPASFANVIGVRCDRSGILTAGQYTYDADKAFSSGIDFTAFARHELVGAAGETVQCPNSNSYATPFVTAQVCKVLQQSKRVPSIEKLRHILHKHSYHPIQDTVFPVARYKNPDWIRRAYVFKEDCGVGSQAPYYFRVAYETQFPRTKAASVIKEVIMKEQAERDLDIKAGIRMGDLTDTIVLLGDMEPVAWQDVKQLALRFGKHIVHIPNKQRYIPVLNGSFRRLRCWQPDERFKMKREEMTPIEDSHIPLICMYYSGGADIIYFLHVLREAFTRDGYQSWIAVDQPAAVLHDMEYLPPADATTGLQERIYVAGTMAYSAYADIVILCTEAADVMDYSKKQGLSGIDIELSLIEIAEAECIQISVRAEHEYREEWVIRNQSVDDIDRFYTCIVQLLASG
ncbi:S8 family serine peptidase [Paenibacillus kribbensis]|uniref:S8 family serine peptidase n=1 Tax=Paenibacillus kribbensis TaxID=172713 RepID=UPI0015B84026|nr:S8 family serine peptidase [Paenibacillus kribbensis]